VIVDPDLLAILACPSCRAPLAEDETASELVCSGPGCGLAYPVRDGIPVLLVAEARRPAPEGDGAPGDDPLADA